MNCKFNILVEILMMLETKEVVVGGVVGGVVVVTKS